MCLVALIQLSVFFVYLPPYEVLFPFFFGYPFPHFFWSHVDYFEDKVECKCWNCNNHRGRALAWGKGCCEWALHVAIVNVCVAGGFFSLLCLLCVNPLCMLQLKFLPHLNCSTQTVPAAVAASLVLLCFPKRIAELQLSCSRGKNCNVIQVNYKVINNDVVGKCVNRAI